MRQPPHPSKDLLLRLASDPLQVGMSFTSHLWQIHTPGGIKTSSVVADTRIRNDEGAIPETTMHVRLICTNRMRQKQARAQALHSTVLVGRSRKARAKASVT